MEVPAWIKKPNWIWVLALWLSLTPAAHAWLDPGAADVDVVLNTEDNQFAFYNGPTGQAEWLLNNGAKTSIRIKGYDDPSALKWDLSSYAGEVIAEAELHLCLTTGSVLNALAVSTINTDWTEGTQWGAAAGTGEPCWRWRSYPDGEWTYKGSDFSTASFGNFGTLVDFGYTHDDTFKQYISGGNTWVAMKLNPAIVYAMVLDNYGLVVTDPRYGWENGNPSIYSSEQNSTVQPRLYIRVASTTDTTSPGAVGGLTAEAGEWNGEVVLSFTAPVDTEDGRAFGYDVRYATHSDFSTATKVERWRIPRPGQPGTRDRLIIENLAPESTYQFWVQAYDKVGNDSSAVRTTLVLPEMQDNPAFADGGFPDPDPVGRVIAGSPGVLNYWACSELAKVNPLTGNRLTDGYTGTGADGYKKANAVWDAQTRTITLRPVRNQVIGFQVIVERLGALLSSISLQGSDLSGPSDAVISADDNLQFFKLHYTSDGPPYPDPAIPLSAPFVSTVDLPGVSNAGGVYQSIWGDLYVPRDTVPGTYTGTLTLNCAELADPIAINLTVIVAAPVLPDKPTFFLDLNGYGNKWSSEASRYQVFQLGHWHRMVPNTLPYGWSESWTADRAPQLSGTGSGRYISDWSTFTATYGPFFDGSAFSPAHPTYPYHGPGEHTAIANFYTTGFEGWPVSISDAMHGYDAGGAGHAHWNGLVDAGGAGLQTFWLEAPDVMAAFTAGYAEGTRNVWTQFAQYAQVNNWTTAFQMYLNNKRTYSGTSALWTLEEQYVADDFRADRWFLGLCRQGWEAAGTPDTRFHWRIDTSTRWQQNWGQLDGIVNLRVQGDGKHWDYRHDRYRRYTQPQPEQRWWYGTGPARTDPLYTHSAELLTHWSHGLDGGLPYWDSYDSNWTTATGSDSGGDATLSVMLSGSNVPGHGFFDGRIATIRMKGMRHGQQLCELLNLQAGQNGWNRNLVSRALSNGYGDHSGVGYDAYGGDEYNNMTILDYYRLQSDLIATLERQLLLGDVNDDRVVDLKDVIVALQVVSGHTTGPIRLAADVDGDGQVGLAEVVFVMDKVIGWR
jgi:hypothetical protein